MSPRLFSLSLREISKKIVQSQSVYERLARVRILSISAFLVLCALFFLLIPLSVDKAALDGAIQLLAQMLAIAAGVLMVGATVSSASYDDSEPILALEEKLSLLVRRLDKWTERRRSKYGALFRRFSRSRIVYAPKLDKLYFSSFDSKGEKSSLFVRRPYADGAFYWVMSSPFGDEANASSARLVQVKALHEAVVCATDVIDQVVKIRKSGFALLDASNGTNGSKWFIEDLESYLSDGAVQLQDQLDIDAAARAIAIALQSLHYMNDELINHVENVDWAPHTLSGFLHSAAQYYIAVCDVLVKLQFLRVGNALSRLKLDSFSDRSFSVDRVGNLYRLRKKLLKVASGLVIFYGRAKYFERVKSMSHSGVVIAMVAFLLMLVVWPLVRINCEIYFIVLGFSVVYSAGLVALLECSWFLSRLLFKRSA
jgi:hypothetical protein